MHGKKLPKKMPPARPAPGGGGAANLAPFQKKKGKSGSVAMESSNPYGPGGMKGD